MTFAEQWPLRDLVLRTPRLELRPDDDEGMRELIEVAEAGVHEPGQMPFAASWTDTDPDHLGRGMLQHFWTERGRLTADRWTLNFLVRFEGQVIGAQGLFATDFGVIREVSTGSWLGRAFHRRGIGTEMRSAVLQFAFDHLGARRARSGAFFDNDASHAVSRGLGYRRDGTDSLVRAGVATDFVRLVLEPADFIRPDWAVQADGVALCLPLLGA